jgi:MFS family permease
MTPPRSVLTSIAPAVSAVFFCFVGVGATISAIPVYVSRQLGFSSFVVGVVVAAQYLAMLLARPAAGNTCDVSGPKAALQRGLLFFLACGLGYWWSAMADGASAKLAILVVARLLLGIAESYIVTGALAWAMRHVGVSRAGIVMAWNGNAMYGGIAVGAPLAGLLNGVGGFDLVAGVSILAAAASASIVYSLPRYGPVGGTRASFHRTAILIAQPGLGLLFATVGYGAILGFANLLFQSNGWRFGYFAISGFGAAYVAVRVFFGGLPDKYGGVRVAFWSSIVESAGQALLFVGTNEYVAVLGAVLSGAGFSLVVPSFGVEAVRRALRQNRGAAMAAYLAFFDLAFGAAIPLAGLLADTYAIRSVYLLGLVCSLGGLVVAITLKPTRKEASFPVVESADSRSE